MLHTLCHIFEFFFRRGSCHQRHWETLLYDPTLCMWAFSHVRLFETPQIVASVHGISQARILEWVAIPFSRGSPWPRGWTCVSHVSCISTWEAHIATLLRSHSSVKAWCCLVLPPPKGRRLKAEKQLCWHCIPSTHTWLVRGKGNQILVESMDELYQLRVTTLVILCCSVAVFENCR